MTKAKTSQPKIATTKSNVLIALLIAHFVAAHSIQSSQIVVEIYRTSDYGGQLIKPKKELLEKRIYLKNNLIYSIKYNGKSSFDSTSFRYAGDTLLNLKHFTNFNHPEIKLVDDVYFIYERNKLIGLTDNNKYISIENFNNGLDFWAYLKINNSDNLTDSLGLINEQLEDLYQFGNKLIKLTHLKNGVVKETYQTVPFPNLFLQYGISQQSLLKNFDIYFDSHKTLLKDHFFFQDVRVIRNYQYLNKLIHAINILVVDKNGKKIWLDKLSFVYKEY